MYFDPTHSSGRAASASCLAQFVVTLGMTGVAGLTNAQSHATASPAPTMVIYLARGQSNRVQDKDQYECYDWSRRKTGFDPAHSAAPASSGKSNGTAAPKGALVQGAARGAAIARLTHGEPRRGAAAGAVGAAVQSRAKEHQAMQVQQQQAAQQQTWHNQERATYDRAISACMEARGYVVK